MTDDQLGPVICPQDTLAVGAEMTCTVTGTAEIGQYANVATVTGTGTAGTTVTDDDPSHHFGTVVEIDLEKFVNGEDADEPPGVEVPVGDPVVMTFEVTNPGNIPVLDVAVTDDQGLAVTFTGGDTDGDAELDPGEVWTYEADLGPASPGRFDNLGLVTGNDGQEVVTEVTDIDPAFAGAVAPPPQSLARHLREAPTDRGRHRQARPPRPAPPHRRPGRPGRGPRPAARSTPPTRGRLSSRPIVTVSPTSARAPAPAIAPAAGR